MKYAIVVAMILALAACSAGPGKKIESRAGAAAQDRVACAIQDDFETGELYGWESYPYAQDIGYEPWTVPQKQPTHNGSKYSIAKIQKPNDAIELSEGFVKRIEGFYTSSDTRFKVAVFLMSDRKAPDLELSLCLEDGRRYFHHVKNAEAGRWLELDVPVSGFTMNGKALRSGEAVQAVTIKANYPVVTHLMSDTICIDDFALNGERARRFVGVNPKSTTFELYGYSVLHKHFFYGDAIGMTVKPEKGGAVRGVTCELVDPSGKKIVSGVPMTSRLGEWTNNKIYTLKPGDPRGQWTINFTGKSSGKQVAWGIRFIVPGEKITRHPRVLLGSDELAKLKSEGSAESKALLAALTPRMQELDISKINEEVGAEPPESLTGGPFAKAQSGDNETGAPGVLARYAFAGAQRYAFGGDEAAGMKAKEALLKLCSFSKWNTGWHEAHGMHLYYPVASQVIGPAANAYDLLYPMLTEQERAAVRQGIMKNALIPCYRDLCEQNRMPSSVTNHIAVMVAGLVKAGVAIYGDDPQNPCVEPYLSGIIAKTKQFIDRTYYPDGAYGEPTTYQEMATRDTVEIADILEKNFGIDYTTTTNLKDTWLYPLYVTYTNGRYPDFGDVSMSYSFYGAVYRWLSYRTKNPYTYFYTQKATARQQLRGNPLNTRLWKIEGVTPKSREELVPSHLFPVKGNMVIRSGWKDDGMVLVFKAGPNSNHYHADQGTFQLMMNGEELLSDAGHGSSYYANLFYPCYYTQPIGHNCMLIDNDAESQVPADYRNGIAALQDWPRMLHSFGGWKAAEAEGDLTCVYKGKVQQYTRSILYMNPDMVFLYDKVKSRDPHTYSWLFHAENTERESSFDAGAGGFDITRTRSSLHVDVLSPKLAAGRGRGGRVRRSDREESYITLSSMPETKDAEFVAVMIPRATTAETAEAEKPVSTLVSADGWTGAKVEKGGNVTVALFRKGEAGAATVEGFTTDAERFSAVTDKAGNVTQAFMRGSRLEKAGRTLVQSAKPVAVSVAYTNGATEIETEAEAGTEISVNVSQAPASVTVDGQAAKSNYDAASGMLTISVPAGHAIVSVK
ncbi:heparinase II/III family protein [bacterium]|nr:heparinase II/III family protein [bacterium]